MSEVVEMAGKREKHGTATSTSEQRLALARRASDYIDQHPGEPITLSRLAEALEVSPWHLQRVFSQVVGVSPKGAALPLDLWDVHFREVRIHGAFGRGTAFRRALQLMPALAAGRLVTRQFPLERIEEGFAHAAAGHGVKTVITPGAA